MKEKLFTGYLWIIISAVFLSLSGCYFEGQTYTAASPSQSVSIKEAPAFPPDLSVSVSFSEPSGNNALDADEEGNISISVKNSGQGKATNLTYTVSPDAVPGLQFPSSGILGDIPPGGTDRSDIPIKASPDVENQDVSFTLMFNEDNGFEPPPVKVNFKVLAMVPPDLIVSDVGINDASGNGMIEPGEVVEVKARIENAGHGLAKDVHAHLRLGKNVYFTPDSKTEFGLGDIPSGAYQDVDFTIFTNMRATDVPVFIDLTEKFRKYDKLGLKLPLVFNRPIQRIQELNVVAKNTPTSESVPVVGGLTPEVDKDIPHSAVRNPNAVALIIAISNYQTADVPPVKYAKRDAAVIRDYLIDAMGYSPENILPQNPDELMTYGQIKTYIQKVLPSYLKPDGNSDLFVYYTGHGAPSTTDHEAYLVPWDCNPNYVSNDNAYEMKQFYLDVEKLNARKKIIVVDACFSGQAGNGQSLIKYASPALLRVNNPLVADSNTVIFQSSGPDQVSNWYDEKRHGMFTYFFLKGLQGAADLNGDGTITAEEMIKYIDNPDDGLPYYSSRLYQRPQQAQIEGDGGMVIERISK